MSATSRRAVTRRRETSRPQLKFGASLHQPPDTVDRTARSATSRSRHLSSSGGSGARLRLSDECSKADYVVGDGEQGDVLKSPERRGLDIGSYVAT
jgi:hypothetical protein